MYNWILVNPPTTLNNRISEEEPVAVQDNRPLYWEWGFVRIKHWGMGLDRLWIILCGVSGVVHFRAIVCLRIVCTVYYEYREINTQC